jgi:hypothetical protein
MARLATILSFGDRADDDAVTETEKHAAADYREEQEHEEEDDATSDASDDSFEFAFARPLAPDGQHPADALADDLFAHGRIVPAYPVFHSNRHHHDSAATAPPSPDTYCAWTPRSAPGSPAREPKAFPKSASTGQAAVPRFRLRDLVGAGAGRRSHSDGKEKFLFLQPTPKTKTTAPPATPAPAAVTKKPSSQTKTKQSKKKAPAAATEMDMATAHRLFYSKPGAGAAAAGAERASTATKTSYLPYRQTIVGFFAAAHGLRPKHHPY